MFKEILSGFNKFFTREKVFILVAFFILGYALMSYSGNKGLVIDRMENWDNTNTNVQNPTNTASVTALQNKPQPPSPSSNDYALKPVSNPSDLLPLDKNSEWTALNPVTMNGNISMPDMLQAGYHIGLDTIGQTLRNANLQLRSDPIIPKMETGPWLQSTIEPDLGRVPLELGYGCK
jgi:hypothetical protein